jgi:hypothetical protein
MKDKRLREIAGGGGGEGRERLSDRRICRSSGIPCNDAKCCFNGSA